MKKEASWLDVISKIDYWKLWSKEQSKDYNEIILSRGHVVVTMRRRVNNWDVGLVISVALNSESHDAVLYNALPTDALKILWSDLMQEICQRKISLSGERFERAAKALASYA